MSLLRGRPETPKLSISASGKGEGNKAGSPAKQGGPFADVTSSVRGGMNTELDGRYDQKGNFVWAPMNDWGNDSGVMPADAAYNYQRNEKGDLSQFPPRVGEVKFGDHPDDIGNSEWESIDSLRNVAWNVANAFRMANKGVVIDESAVIPLDGTRMAGFQGKVYIINVPIAADRRILSNLQKLTGNSNLYKDEFIGDDGQTHHLIGIKIE